MAYFQGHSFSAIHLNHQYAICNALHFCNKSKLKVPLGTPYKALSKSTTSITEFTDTTIFIKTIGLPVLHLESTIKNIFCVIYPAHNIEQDLSLLRVTFCSLQCWKWKIPLTVMALLCIFISCCMFFSTSLSIELSLYCYPCTSFCMLPSHRFILLLIVPDICNSFILKKPSNNSNIL